MSEKTLNIEKKIILDEPMKNHTTFKIGGKADLFVDVKTTDELCEALVYAKEKKLKVTVIGNGSNILVSDKGIRGLTIKINIQNLEIDRKKEQIEVTVGAGYKLPLLARKTFK